MAKMKHFERLVTAAIACPLVSPHLRDLGLVLPPKQPEDLSHAAVQPS